jgi:hypothetical protein
MSFDFENSLNLHNFISATQTKNFILDDPIQDWLKLYGKQNGFNPVKKASLFSNFIKKKGLEFEEHIVKMLRNKHYFFEVESKLSNQEKYEITMKKLKEGVPIIYQGMVVDFDEKLFGYPDLIVRSDYLNKITNFKNTLPDNNLENGWYYVVVDVKYSNLIFKRNSDTLVNQGMFSCFKSQLIIYNKCLTKMQQYDPGVAFILGRKWNKNNKNGNNSFDYLGKIDIYGDDKQILEKTDLALNWLRDLRQNGNSWETTDSRLMPNMKCAYDDEWRSIKKEIAQNNNEITLLWNCGVKERNSASKKRVRGWDDSECYSNTMGIKGKRAKIIDGILKTNRDNQILFNPRRIKLSENIKKLESNKLEFICDFETVNDLNDNFKRIPYSNFETCIFMIGLITNIRDDEGNIQFSEFNCFIVEDFTRKEEKRIINQWLGYMDNLSKKYNVLNPKIYHWSQAEPNFYKQAILRNKQIFEWGKLNFVDILEVFKEEPISIKGVLNYGLKDVSKGLYKLGIIDTTWEEDMDGRIALLEAADAMNKAKIENLKFSEMNIVKSIEKYNYVDVKVIDDIITFLRTKI